jgi:hypothetical protein
MDSNPFSNSSILSALQDTLKLYSNRVGTAIACSSIAAHQEFAYSVSLRPPRDHGVNRA